jgi:SAM-dependent methyltransferase
MGFYAGGLAIGADKPPPHIDWEEPRCLLCNSDRASMLLEAPDTLPDEGGLWFAIAQCQDCGLCFTCPRPSDQVMARFYPMSYPPHHKSVRKLAHHWWRRFTWWRHGRHEPLAGKPPCGQGRLLDFGCGSGAFLERMRQAGWNVTGLDTSEKVVQRIRHELRLPALVGSLPHPELGDNSFDVVTMRHSLEHVHRPLEVLRAAHRLLAAGGKLIVSVPNIDSLPFSWFGRYWRGLDLPRHLTHFTPDTLQLMLARAGFDVGPVRMVRHPASLRRSAHLAARHADVSTWQRWLCRRLVASVATWYSFLMRRCDGMVVTAVKGSPIAFQPLPAFSPLSSMHPRFPADRWRNT